jgi:hypothetical protein
MEGDVKTNMPMLVVQAKIRNKIVVIKQATQANTSKQPPDSPLSRFAFPGVSMEFMMDLMIGEDERGAQAIAVQNRLPEVEPT